MKTACMRHLAWNTIVADLRVVCATPACGLWLRVRALGPLLLCVILRATVRDNVPGNSGNVRRSWPSLQLQHRPRARADASLSRPNIEAQRSARDCMTSESKVGFPGDLYAFLEGAYSV
ncbi:hypothetical protein FKP32DRAFT_1586788 [Trametes sanguinea]|nr:hypothetical protein FKP32DRAFT_1586788 [Trametes sanguinea]